MVWLWVAIGSALGGMARYGVTILSVNAWGITFPWGTLLINVLGSFVIGLFGTLTLPNGPLPASPDLRVFVMVGICGGFTTFSSFSLQTLDLLRAGETVRAAAYVLLSVVLCIAFVFFGFWLGSRVGLSPQAGP